MNKPYKQKVSVSLDEDIIAEIKELAENDDRSFCQYINLVLKEHIAKIKDREEQGSYQSVLHLEDALFFSVGIFLIKEKNYFETRGNTKVAEKFCISFVF